MAAGGVLAVAMLSGARAARAQQGLGQKPSTAESMGHVLAGCDGKIISAVVVHPAPPYSGDLPGVLGRAADLAGRVHETTRPRVAYAFLPLHEGDVCTEARRAESERVLRALPFIVRARITTADDGKGGVRLDVYTVDEISLIAEAGVQSTTPFVNRLRLGDGNVDGSGMLAQADWRDGYFYRNHFGGQFIAYTLAGKPIGLDLQGSRDELGGGWEGTLVRPFYSDYQPLAWLVDGGTVHGFVPFQPATSPNDVDLDYYRYFLQLGALVRLGRPGHLTVYGVTLSQERESPGRRPIILGDSGAVRDTVDTFASQYQSTQVARINAFWGFRDITYRRVQGFDALTADQDMAVGVQFGTQLGHSLDLLGARGQDVFSSSTLYAGWGTRRTFFGIQATGEGREDLLTQRWDGILAGTRLAWYYKPATNHTIIVSSEGGLGLHQRLPFALYMSDPDGGVRGYASAHITGGARDVNRIEERWSWGTFRRIADIGMATFVDAGRMWAEGVPYGVNTSEIIGAGFSLLAAVPPHSKRLIRIDFGQPITRAPYSSFEIRFSTTDNTSSFYTEPRDLARARERTVPTSVFQFPPTQ